MYPALYAELFQRIGKPKTILDLGCGLNPVSYPFMGLEDVTYFCCDVDEQDIHFLQAYFACIPALHGTATVLDLSQINAVKKLPQADVAFLFKVLDPLERGKKGHRLAEAIITAVPARHIIASFSTQTISGKQMNHPYRGWMERMLTRLQFSFTAFATENEFFYIMPFCSLEQSMWSVNICPYESFWIVN